MKSCDDRERAKACEQYSALRERELHLEQLIEFVSRRASRIRASAHLNKRFSKRTFDTFKPLGHEKEYDACYGYAKGFISNQGEGLLLMGGYGTGKTHLAAAITNYLLDVYEIPVRFISSIELLEALRNFKTDAGVKTLNECKTIDLLVIDDLGKEKCTDWTLEKLCEIINARYENELPIVITTNEGAEGLERAIGGAAFSRLHEMCKAVLMVGSDWRMQ